MKNSERSPRSHAVVRAVGWVSFLEILRDKVLYNIVLCAVLLLGVGYLASRLTFIHPERVVLDFGLSAVTLSCCMIAVFTGAGLLGKEFERRTIFVALCHPITRTQFVVGKYCGLFGILLCNWFLLSLVYLVILALSSPGWFDCFSWVLFFGLLFVLLESMVVASITMLFSSFSTTSLSAICAIGFFLIGNNISQIRMLATRVSSPTVSFLLNSAAAILPNLEHFSFGEKVTYSLPVPWQFLGVGVIYGSVVIALCLKFAGILMQSREV